MHGVVGVKEITDDLDFSIFPEPCYWIALLTNNERKACIWLKRRQFKPYWPRYRGMTRLNRHRRQMRWRSVLPGYLFLPFPMNKEPNCRLIEESPGSRGIMRNGSFEPRVLNDGHVQQIRRIEDALNASELNAAEGIPFKVGQRVRVTNDAYWQFEGPILKIDNKRRIWLEVELFGAKRHLTVPASELEAV